MQGNKVIIFFLFFFTYSNGHPIFDGNEFSDEDTPPELELPNRDNDQENRVDLIV